MDHGRRGEVYNIGGEREVTILELFELAKSVTQSSSAVTLTEHFIPDHRGRCPDTSKVRGLGWRPLISLREGLEQSYADLLRMRPLTAAEPARLPTLPRTLNRHAVA
jgi:nucleoside-diphosphate-sugar epimerase